MKIKEIDILEFRKEVYKHYKKLFPPRERKPYIVIKRLYKRGILKLYKIIDENQFVGFLITSSIRNNGCLKLDYFAILPQYQSKGYGGQVIKKLKEISKDYYGIFIEVEKIGLGRDEEENKIREKRIKFYERNGFKKLNFEMEVFNVIFSSYILFTNDTIKNEKVLEDVKKLYLAEFGGKKFNKYIEIKAI